MTIAWSALEISLLSLAIAFNVVKIKVNLVRNLLAYWYVYLLVKFLGSVPRVSRTEALSSLSN